MNNIPSFLFYDIETTGLNSAFDQILIFAAIRTDRSLNEIERYSLTINMRPDIVPSPGAFITHRLLPEDLVEGVCEYEGALIIHSIVNRPGTVSIGYNNLGFDDEFLRFTFYRNMLEPYSHQYTNGCYRIDLLPIATLYRVVKPEIIKWPTTDVGKSSLKLELISKENKFITSGRAHNAMADVEATIELAKCLSRENKIWTYALGLFDKRSEKTRIDKLLVQTFQENYPTAIMISHKLGAESIYIAPVIGIGRSYHYTNQSLWIRLDKDIIKSPALLKSEGTETPLNTDAQSAPYTSTPSPLVIRKKDGEIGIILPVFPRFWGLLSEEQRVSAENNISIINKSKENHAIFNKIAEYHRQFKYPLVPEADLDSLLYQSPFFTNAEKRDMERFHKISLLSKKIELIEDMKPSRIKSIATRIFFRNYFNKDNQVDDIFPHRFIKAIHEEEVPMHPLIYREYTSYMERVRCSSNDPDFNIKKIVGFKGDERLVPSKAIKDLKEIRCDNTLDNEQKKILDWLELYIGSI